MQDSGDFEADVLSACGDGGCRCESVSVSLLGGGILVSRGLSRSVLRGYRYIEVTDLGVRRKIVTGKRQHNNTEPVLVEGEWRFIVTLHDSLSGERANVAASRERLARGIHHVDRCLL